MTLVNVILAAGQGTRMKSKLAKQLHPVAGKPLVDHSVDIAWQLAGQAPVVVVGLQSDAVRAHLGDRAIFVEQAERRGTGHAVQVTAGALRGKADLVLVCYADMPLLRPETLQRLIDTHTASDARPAMTMLTYVADDARGFGRIARHADGTVAAIVEEAAATPEQKQIRELNVGVYVFEGEWLWDALDRVQPTPPKNEYYLTDTVALANEDGRTVLAVEGDDPDELIGINTRVHLAEAEAAMRRRINEQHMLNGVTITDPATTYIDADVTIGQDTVILPNTHLTGRTTIGEDCEIGPGAMLDDATVGNGCRVFASVIQQSTLEDRVDMGPFVRVRGGARLGRGVHMGNFGEIKNSVLGEGVKMGHFSYLGDAEVGPGANIGAGTITCNYDGVNKHRTIIGAGAFIGSDTMLIAPVEIGAGAQTGAGAVVRHAVPAGKVAVGVPARVIGDSRIAAARAAKKAAQAAENDNNTGG
ncbi:MAG: bifunctional UDP-N-acetylglucosamine diphosphorylase/glucosamine-1-phosphate N-acetyltransferase GlmU [Anaerolineae bacterium]|nr:bifunctional UDP-N-acetylglucosamine diphosphorylase/glucosamine-1-phosphate N-acetyltransferase GlmU [Anaerolineae bacterium]